VSEMQSESVLSWAADAVGAGAKVVAVKGMHGGSGPSRPNPWRLRIDRGGRTSDVVLRVVVAGWIDEEAIATDWAAALRVAEEHGLAAPWLIASDPVGRATGGIPATLETAVPGSSALPAKVSTERLREAGAAIAAVHAVPLEPRRDLPLRIRPIQVSTTMQWRDAGDPVPGLPGRRKARRRRRAVRTDRMARRSRPPGADGSPYVAALATRR
jgi:hypothetical protein